MIFDRTILNISLCAILPFASLNAQQKEIQSVDAVTLFAPNAVSGPHNDFNASFSESGKTVFFSRSTADFGLIAIYYAKNLGGKWSEAKPVAFTGSYRDTDPIVSPDGKRLYFCSDRPLPGKTHVDFDYHFYFVELEGDKIVGDPQLVEIEGNPKAIYPSFTKSGDIYYSIQGDIYYSKWTDGKFRTPEALSFNDPSMIDFDPVVSSDGKFIIFTSSNRKGYGSNDLYICFKEGEKWTAPQNLGNKINGPGREGTPGLSRDNQTLFFSASKNKPKQSPEKRRSAKELSDVLNSYQNGLPNIYFISIVDIIKR